MIFVDVGAHDGQTLEEAVRYEFDRIYAFEPMPREFANLQARFGDMDNVELWNYGLGDRTETRNVYGTNDEMEASIYAAKEDVSPDAVTPCAFMRASEFFAGVDEAFVKLNCEGSEVPILANLIHTELIWKAKSILVDFDVRRIPGLEDGEQETLKRLKQIGYDRLLRTEDAVPNGSALRQEGRYRYTRRDEIMCWLKSLGVAER